MQFISVILLMFGILSKVWSEDLNENKISHSLAVVPTEENEPGAQDGIKQSSELSSANLTEIHEMAKNISHSKGIFRETNNGTEIRRSILKKATVTSESDIMKELLSVFKSSENKLELLEEMEYLVHQYDVAIEFAKMGGITTISPLLFSDDDELTSSTLLVLGAALQSNPTVQNIAKDLYLGRVLLNMLSRRSPAVISRVLFTLSSFLRNAPEVQEEFLIDGGIPIIIEVLMKTQFPDNIKLKIINLFNDLAVELRTAMEDEKGINLQIYAVEKLFIAEMKRFEVCNLIASFLSYEDFDIILKTVEAMLSLDHYCHRYFISKDIIFTIERLLSVYYPGPSIYDKELNTPLYNEIRRLYAIVEKDQYYYLKDEL